MSALGTVGSIAVGLVWGWLLNPIAPRAADFRHRVEATRRGFMAIATAFFALEIAGLQTPQASALFLIAASLTAVSLNVGEGRLRQMIARRREGG